MESVKKISVFDTTLRDGQQCPGAGMSFANNLRYAHLAAELCVDVLEAGFPAASKTDFQIVDEIAAQLHGGPIITALCQLRSEQIDITLESLKKAQKARLHTYVPVDPVLMRASLGPPAEDKETILKQVSEYILRATEAGVEVQFSPEGYSRQNENFDFTTDLLRAAVESGATILNCPDTIGGSHPFQANNYFVTSMNTHADIIQSEYPDKQIAWSVHCHNDLGLAVANTLRAIIDGPATQIEGCINGVGERAGNAALEQCIMALRYFQSSEEDFSLYTDIKTEKLQEISNFVHNYMLPRQPHWPISGENAARHSSGGHTNAILKHIDAYQPFDPKESGNRVSLLFGPLSGSNHAKSIIEKAGYRCEAQEKSEIAQFIKDTFHERRKGVTDSEVLKAYFKYRSPIEASSIDYSRNGNSSTVILKGRFYSNQEGITAEYNGQDSALAAIKSAIDVQHVGLEIVSHKSQSEGHGIGAKSLSKIILVDLQGEEFVGEGKDRDIEISAMKALLAAANRAYVETKFRLPEKSYLRVQESVK